MTAKKEHPIGIESFKVLICSGFADIPIWLRNSFTFAAPATDLNLWMISAVLS